VRGDGGDDWGWLVNGWTEEAAAQGAPVMAPFDKWCPGPKPASPAPLESDGAAGAAAAAEAGLKAAVLQLSSGKHDAVLREPVVPEEPELAAWAAGWEMGEWLPTALVALAVDKQLQACRYRLVRKKFTCARPCLRILMLCTEDCEDWL